ncbi:hypothetical protein [Bacillus pretiosus]|uniref:ImmA/IrrE family metallo-endopeptidase n=1 Tax=Bacillus pretiosus TaxID=2983392 RepID=UPI002EDA78A3
MDLCVGVSAVVAGGNVGHNRIQRDIDAANEVWKTCGIRFLLERVITIGTVDVSDTIGMGVTTFSNPPKILNMLSIRPPGSSRFSIVIYYVYGNRFLDGSNGVSPYPLPLTQGGPRPSIIHTNDAHPDFTATRFVLAHELGHTLFLNPNDLTLTNPSPTATSDGYHDVNPNNLMYVGGVGTNPTINKEQCEKARSSALAPICQPILIHFHPPSPPIPIHIILPHAPIPPYPPPGPPPPGPPSAPRMFL